MFKAYKDVAVLKFDFFSEARSEEPILCKVPFVIQHYLLRIQSFLLKQKQTVFKESSPPQKIIISSLKFFQACMEFNKDINSGYHFFFLYPCLYSAEERNPYRFRTTWGWVHFHFRMNYHFN